MSISYSPKYKLLIANVDPVGSRIVTLREVRSLQSLTCDLVTDPQVGTLTATWADTDFSTFGDTVSRPKPMVLVQLQLADKQGQWGIAWTGIADSITRTVNFGQSKTYTLQASSPYKLFNITLQSASAASGLAVDYALGIKGTAVLNFAAQQCTYPGIFSLLSEATGWGYRLTLNQPGTKGPIDYSADVGAFTWGAISAAAFVSPAQQSYSAILQSLVADTEIEFFFNEVGQLIWRPLAYLNVTGHEKIIQKDSILNHSWTESDQGVLTNIFVRYNAVPNQYTQGVWNAPSAMTAALKKRAMVFYTPWITSKSGADALAAALGLRYSGNMHTVQLTMIADPGIGVGTTIRVPKFPDLMPVDNTQRTTPQVSKSLAVEVTPWYYYYVYGVTYNLQVGGQWSMTLDLRYGRDEKLQFPYLNYSPYLTDYIPSSSDSAATISRVNLINFDGDTQYPARIGTPFTLVTNQAAITKAIAAQKLASDPTATILVDPTIPGLAPGSLVLLKGADGTVLGEYTTAAGPPGTTATIPSNPTGASQGFITIEQVDGYSLTDSGVNATSTPAGPPNTDPTTPSNVPQAPAPIGGGKWWDVRDQPHNFPAMNLIYWPVPSSTHSAQGFGPTGYPKEPSYPYVHGRYPDNLNVQSPFHTGIDLSVGMDTPVYAPGSGTVVSAMPPCPGTDGTTFWGYGITGTDSTGYGNMITLQVGQLFLLFAHLDTLLVAAGQQVQVGQLIGLSGSSGNSSAPHLHFGIYDPLVTRPAGEGNGMFVDPQYYLDSCGAVTVGTH